MKLLNKKSFFFIFIFFCVSLWLISNLIIITNYEKIEKNKNITNIHTIIFNIDNEIKDIESSVSDYAKWDDTYNFINNSKKDYIFRNFKQGTDTLENLNIDYMIFANINNNIKFSKYHSNFKQINTKLFEDTILNKFQNTEKKYQLMIFDNNPYFIIKKEIKKSDGLGIANGYIYSGKLLTIEYINIISKVFKEKEISLKKPRYGYEKLLKSNYLEKLTFSTIIKEDKIFNSINFYSNEEFLFSIKTKNDSEIINEGKYTTFIYSLSITILFSILLLIIYRTQRKLESFNSKLEKEVRFRTNDLNKNIRLVEEKNKELYKLANIDTLTQIKNRRSFFIESTRLLEKAISEEKNFSIILIDIDYFKKINDQYGHIMGDIVLQEFCKIVNNTIEKEEVFARLGGEEFSISVFNKSDEKVNSLAERIRKNIEKSILEIKEEKIKFTISLGICSTNSTKYKDIDLLLQEADTLLYKAKNEGRNKIIRI